MLTSTNTSLKVRIVLLTEQAINLWLSAPTSKSCLYLSRLYSSLVVLSIDQTPLRLQNQSSGRLMTGCRGSGRIRSFHLLHTLFKSSNTPFCPFVNLEKDATPYKACGNLEGKLTQVLQLLSSAWLIFSLPE